MYLVRRAGGEVVEVPIAAGAKLARDRSVDCESRACLSCLYLLGKKSLNYFSNFAEVQARQGFPAVSRQPLLFPQRFFHYIERLIKYKLLQPIWGILGVTFQISKDLH